MIAHNGTMALITSDCGTAARRCRGCRSQRRPGRSSPRRASRQLVRPATLAPPGGGAPDQHASLVCSPLLLSSAPLFSSPPLLLSSSPLLSSAPLLCSSPPLCSPPLPSSPPLASRVPKPTCQPGWFLGGTSWRVDVGYPGAEYWASLATPVIMTPGTTSRRRDCHSAAAPSPFSGRFNRRGEGCQQNDSLADG